MPTAAGLDQPPADPVLARLGGGLEWLCPYCHSLNRSYVDRLRPRVQCINLACRRTLGVGLIGVTDQRIAAAPFNAEFARPLLTASGTWFNQAGPSPLAPPAIARATGPIDWLCSCGATTIAYLDWVTGEARCHACQSQRWFAVRLLDLSGTRPRLPADWLLPGSKRRTLDRHRLATTRALRGSTLRAERRGRHASKPAAGGAA